jgi:hypothetical protein
VSGPKRHPRKSAAIFFLFLMFISLLVLTAETATIKMKTGEIYKDVTPDVFDFYRTVLFEYQGRRISVNFTDIEYIADSTGKDITAEILGPGNDEERQELLSKGPKKPKSPANRPWKALLSLGLNYSIPAGDYYEGITGGVGFDGDLRFAVNDKIAIQVIVSRSGMKPDENYPLFKDNPWLIDAINIRTTRYEVAVNFFQPFSKKDSTRAIWYNFAGLGLANHSIGLNMTLKDISTGEIYMLNGGYSDNRFVMVFGFGVMAMLSDKYGFDFSGTADMVPFITGKYSPEGKGIVFSRIFDLKISAVVMF